MFLTFGLAGEHYLYAEKSSSEEAEDQGVCPFVDFEATIIPRLQGFDKEDTLFFRLGALNLR